MLSAFYNENWKYNETKVNEFNFVLSVFHFFYFTFNLSALKQDKTEYCFDALTSSFTIHIIEFQLGD